MYRSFTWLYAKPDHKMKVELETNKLSKSSDLYACAIKIKHQFFDTWLTVGHIPREISRLSYFFMDEGDNITRHLISTTYKVSHIPAGGLEVPSLLTLSVKRERIFKLKRSFVNDLYDDYYTGEQAENNEEESGDEK